MPNHIMTGKNGRAGNVLGFESLYPFSRRAIFQCRLRHFESSILVQLKACRVLKSRIIQPPGFIDGPRQANPLGMTHYCHTEVAIGGLIDQVDETLRCLGCHLVTNERMTTHVRTPQKRHDGIQH